MNETQNPEVVSQVPAVQSAPVHTVLPSFPTKEEWETMSLIAKTLHQGGVMPKSIDTVPKMMIALQAGKEIGLMPIESLNSLYFVNGKISMYGDAVPNQIIRAGHKITWGTCNAKEATVTITRKGTDESMTATLTWEDAVRRGYTNNPIWTKYPENMLKWRALSMAKIIVTDALRGISIKEDIEGEASTVGSKFHSAEVEQRTAGEVIEGTYSKRPTLAEKLAGEAQEAPQTKVGRIKKK
jgi:hypothetical protein